MKYDEIIREIKGAAKEDGCIVPTEEYIRRLNQSFRALGVANQAESTILGIAEAVRIVVAEDPDEWYVHGFHHECIRLGDNYINQDGKKKRATMLGRRAIYSSCGTVDDARKCRKDEPDSFDRIADDRWLRPVEYCEIYQLEDESKEYGCVVPMIDDLLRRQRALLEANHE